ncbi:hypothetical protein FNV43_RR14141 [Rhamnella rubrinervis]|uniref:Uncharacterized protein n=1 Tax=Rhamnella rubrinervis TaxID=2594499 RepID=A0A8K0H2I1_9ROSA|nr:hypothetical protein FNV43_RR14141 [Rhamnella rubrinervis]
MVDLTISDCWLFGSNRLMDRYGKFDQIRPFDGQIWWIQLLDRRIWLSMDRSSRSDRLIVGYRGSNQICPSDGQIQRSDLVGSTIFDYQMVGSDYQIIESDWIGQIYPSDG